MCGRPLLHFEAHGREAETIEAHAHHLDRIKARRIVRGRSRASAWDAGGLEAPGLAAGGGGEKLEASLRVLAAQIASRLQEAQARIASLESSVQALLEVSWAGR